MQRAFARGCDTHTSPTRKRGDARIGVGASFDPRLRVLKLHTLAVVEKGTGSDNFVGLRFPIVYEVGACPFSRRTNLFPPIPRRNGTGTDDNRSTWISPENVAEPVPFSARRIKSVQLQNLRVGLVCATR